MYIENDREDRSATLIQRLLDLDYRLYWHLPPMFSQSNYFHNPKNAFGRIVSVNTLCVPRGEDFDIEGLPEISDSASNWRNALE